jgi:hypothetical protein
VGGMLKKSGEVVDTLINASIHNMNHPLSVQIKLLQICQ